MAPQPATVVRVCPSMYAPEIGQGSAAPNADNHRSTDTPWVQKTYQHSGRAALMADWPSVVISEAGEREEIADSAGARPPANNNN